MPSIYKVLGAYLIGIVSKILVLGMQNYLYKYPQRLPTLLRHIMHCWRHGWIAEISCPRADCRVTAAAHLHDLTVQHAVFRHHVAKGLSSVKI